MRRLAAVVVALAALTVVVDTGIAGADFTRDARADQDGSGDATVTVESVEDVEVVLSSGGQVTCRVLAEVVIQNDTSDLVALDGPLVEGHQYWLMCFDATDGNTRFSRFFTYDPSQPLVPPATLARWARATLSLAFPAPRINPPADQLVGFETWFWVDGTDWQPVSATASIPGLSATVEARPTGLGFDPGDGSPSVSCIGPGRAYDPSAPAATQHTDCAHVYQYDGSYVASVTVRWTLRWRATDGSGGSLAPADRTTSFPVEVIERQAVGT